MREEHQRQAARDLHEAICVLDKQHEEQLKQRLEEQEDQHAKQYAMGLNIALHSQVGTDCISV